VPPELRVFEARAEEMAHHSSGTVKSSQIHSSHHKSS